MEPSVEEDGLLADDDWHLQGEDEYVDYCKECGSYLGDDMDNHKAHCSKMSQPELNDKWKNDNNPIRPKYYAKYKIDPWTFFMENKLDMMTASVIKYTMRHADKSGKEDLNKAIKCLEMIKEYYYNEKS